MFSNTTSPNLARIVSLIAGRVAASLKRSGCWPYHWPVPRTDICSRMVPAPISEVYAALVDPEALSAWVPPGDMTGTIERFEPRPGGSYRMVLRYPDHSPSRGKTTSDTDVVEARFIDLVPDKSVAYSVNFVSDDPDYDGAMTMRWEVTDTDRGTLVEITADNVPDAVSAQDHAAGMNSSLQKLSDYVVKSGQASPLAADLDLWKSESVVGGSDRFVGATGNGPIGAGRPK
jgi:uncharacterized protein YndB with AHSA1/START domain